MASGDAEIKDGFNIPVWMKTRPTRLVIVVSYLP